MCRVDTAVYKLRSRIHQNSVCISLAGARENLKKKKLPSSYFFMENDFFFSISILEVWHSFLKEPIQHIRGALGVPCWPCVGLECFYLQFINLIQIRARLNPNSVDVLQHL